MKPRKIQEDRLLKHFRPQERKQQERLRALIKAEELVAAA